MRKRNRHIFVRKNCLITRHPIALWFRTEGDIISSTFPRSRKCKSKLASKRMNASEAGSVKRAMWSKQCKASNAKRANGWVLRAKKQIDEQVAQYFHLFLDILNHSGLVSKRRLTYRGGSIGETHLPPEAEHGSVIPRFGLSEKLVFFLSRTGEATTYRRRGQGRHHANAI